MDGLGVVLLLCTAGVAMCMEKMVMERARMEDQESSATGYTYSSGSPQYAKAIKVEVPYAFGYVPVPSSYQYQFLPVVDDTLHYVPKVHEDAQFSAYGYPSAMDEIEANKKKYGYGKPWKYGSEGFKKESENKASQGEKGDKGYKKVLGWDKGSKGHVDKELQKGWYGAGGGNKQGHYDEGQYWLAKEEEGKGEKGGKFKAAKGHKKGAKTNGYHKVYNKDEYKKDHEFYDHADKKGFFNKYGNFDQNHSKGESGFEKGGHENYGHYADGKGKKGYYNKGHYDGEDKGHKAARGSENFHKNYEEYKKKAAHRDGNKFAYTDANGVKWKY